MQLVRDRRAWFVAGILAVIGIGTYLWWGRQSALPGRESALYQEYQRAFQVGVAALDAGRPEIAKPNLERAVAMIPDEPAGWANLAILSLHNNDFKEAAKHLKRARDLAPHNPALESLMGQLAEKQGRQADAIGHYRKALEARPHDTALLFTLASAVSREGGEGTEAEYQRLLEQILKQQPNNLRVLLKRGLVAFQRKDQAAFEETMERLARLAPEWIPPSPDEPGAKKRLGDVREAAAKAPRDVPHLLALLENILKQERSYKADSAAITAPESAPIYAFMRLAPPRNMPALPDRDLTFRVESLMFEVLEDKTHWNVVRPVWRIGELERKRLKETGDKGGHTIRPADTFKLTIFLANAREVRRADDKSVKLSFPGGPNAVAPSAAGVLPIDLDNDYRTDVVLAGAGGLRFWQQQPDGTYADVTAETKLPKKILDDDYYGAWAADLDMDGDLDIIAARRSGAPVMLRNNRAGHEFPTFTAMEPFAGVRDVRGFVWADLDNDGAPDAVLLDTAGKLHPFVNERHTQFTAWPLPDTAGKFLAATAADVNDDGVFDLVALRADGGLVRISDQDKRKSWQVADLAKCTVPADAAPGNHTLFVEDLDNNGTLDLAVAGPTSAHVFLADEKGKFSLPVIDVAVGAAMLFDVHQDGRLDFLGLVDDPKSDARQLHRALNIGKKNYRWHTIWPLAHPLADNRINTYAIGGEIEIRAGMLVQKQPIHGPVVHFGLGEQLGADVARIVWPNGAPQWEFDMPGFRFLPVVQRLTGSCPFLFTYDGTGMRFAGDCMWGTPLGMFVNGQNIGEFPQTTEWLKIPGAHLVPRDGYYDVRVHACLWETDYFDQVALIVADHPANTELHVDERFFLTPTPPRLHVTTPARPVASALDHHGKDATEEIRAIDGRYLDRAARSRFQGVVEDHWVEIDLGDDAPREGPVLLVARGWLQPTNSSINTALAQGKHAMPQPLSLEVPDGKGGWKVALPALGFPAGKDKTMLIRLDDLGEPSPVSGRVTRRFRLRTSMAIYWDFLGYATELDPKLAQLQRPAPSAAELRYRGILQITKKNQSSPEIPVYDNVMPRGQTWRDLTGFYTRFGDVTELLAKVDDRYVIMNAGDEIALRFPVSDGPAAGMKRDFIWECDGWTRDGDLNTRFGNSVLPLPAHGVKTDDRPPGRLHDDPVYRRFPRDWQTYHTRYVTSEAFALGLRNFRR